MKLKNYEIMILETDKARFGYQITFREEGTEKFEVAYLGQKDKGDYIRFYLGNSTYAKKNRGKYYYLHRIIYAWKTGMDYNLNGMEVHHLNHNKQDNRIENLILLSKTDHRNIHKRTNQLTEEDKKKIRTAIIIRDRAIKKARGKNYGLDSSGSSGLELDYKFVGDSSRVCVEQLDLEKNKRIGG